MGNTRQCSEVTLNLSLGGIPGTLSAPAVLGLEVRIPAYIVR